MEFLILDTETNGLPDYRLRADDPAAPHLAAAAMIRVALDEHGDGEIAEATMLYVKPDGWTMTAEAQAVNGLTDDFLHVNGLPVGDVLDVYEGFVRSGCIVAAYNARHDCKIMRGAFRRAGRDDLFETTLNTCCMMAVRRLDSFPGVRGWPKLEVAYQTVAGRPLVNAHNAMADAEACLVILRALIRKGALIPPAVYFAKEKPDRPHAPARGPGF